MRDNPISWMDFDGLREKACGGCHGTWSDDARGAAAITVGLPIAAIVTVESGGYLAPYLLRLAPFSPTFARLLPFAKSNKSSNSSGVCPLQSSPAVNKSSGQLGQEGEAAVEKITGLLKNKERFLVNGRLRIPDFVDATAIHEVKNVGSLSYTSQLKDYVKIANDSGRQLNLWVRADTKLSGPLKNAIDQGLIKLNFIK